MPVLRTSHKFAFEAPGFNAIENLVYYIMRNLEHERNTPEQRQMKNKLFHRAMFEALDPKENELDEGVLRKYYYENGRPVSLELDTITFPNTPQWDDGIEKFQITKMEQTRQTVYKLDRVPNAVRELVIVNEPRQ